MQCSTRNSVKLARALALSAALLFFAASSSLVASSAFAQQDNSIGGFASLAIAGTFQDTKLGKGAGSLSDATGAEFKLGFFPADWIAVNLPRIRPVSWRRPKTFSGKPRRCKKSGSRRSPCSTPSRAFSTATCC